MTNPTAGPCPGDPSAVEHDLAETDDPAVLECRRDGCGETVSAWLLKIKTDDRTEAVEYAKGLNDAYDEFLKRDDADPVHDARWHAVVIPWDGTPEEHAEELARPDRLET